MQRPLQKNRIQYLINCNTTSEIYKQFPQSNYRTINYKMGCWWKMNKSRAFVELTSYIDKSVDSGTLHFKLNEVQYLYVNRLYWHQYARTDQKEETHHAVISLWHQHFLWQNYKDWGMDRNFYLWTICRRCMEWCLRLASGKVCSLLAPSTT